MAALLIGVIGPADATAAQRATAEEVGRRLAERGAIVVCGGLGGVMEGACRGAQQAGGITVGLLPGHDPHEANAYVTVPLATGLGELRNGLIVRACRALIAIGGGPGTLSEIALAWKAGRPVVGLDTWDVDGVTPVQSASEAVAACLAPAK